MDCTLIYFSGSSGLLILQKPYFSQLCQITVKVVKSRKTNIPNWWSIENITKTAFMQAVKYWPDFWGLYFWISELSELSFWTFSHHSQWAENLHLYFAVCLWSDIQSQDSYTVCHVSFLPPAFHVCTCKGSELPQESHSAKCKWLEITILLWLWQCYLN